MNKNDLNMLTNVFGFGAAMEALDNLVKMATVGGSKEKKPTDEGKDDGKQAVRESKEDKFTRDVSFFARQASAIHEELTGVGFDDDQAFELLCLVLLKSKCG